MASLAFSHAGSLASKTPAHINVVVFHWLNELGRILRVATDSSNSSKRTYLDLLVSFEDQNLCGHQRQEWFPVPFASPELYLDGLVAAVHLVVHLAPESLRHQQLLTSTIPKLHYAFLKYAPGFENHSNLSRSGQIFLFAMNSSTACVSPGNS